MASETPPFWESKKLDVLSSSEWESLCDGCGKCCLHKLQDEDTDAFLFTCISCEFLDTDSCQCTVYDNRNNFVPDCLNLKVSDLPTVSQWLPTTCAYRLLYEGKALPEWHPLVAGSKKLMHENHISVRSKAVSEREVPEEDWEDYIIWEDSKEG
jgi:uncharacterized cysteine cluster protein YcgN (CxxCxxCC family)